MSTPSDIEGFRWLLDTARREAERLLDTTHRLFRDEIDAAWVDALEQSPELAERVDAFGARFGRLQDGIGHKLIPELRRLLLEPPAAALDNHEPHGEAGPSDLGPPQREPARRSPAH
jgi:hypothetical protein